MQPKNKQNLLSFESLGPLKGLKKTLHEPVSADLSSPDHFF